MNVTGVNSSGAVTSLEFQAALKEANLKSAGTPPSLLRGASLTVSETSDIEKLAALLLEETNKSRKNSQTSQMQVLSSGVLDKLREKNLMGYVLISSVANQIKALKEQLAAGTGDTNAIKTQIAEKEKVLDTLVSNLDGESYRALVESLLESAPELSDTAPLEDESEDDVGVGNIPLDERSVASIIRDSLRRLDGDLVDSLETRREAHV